ncbi:hypothetical protein [Streptomyces sp. NBC_00459]|uniref:hypothetical protein n=1 Tax=Streptomyces sp. NBC_00459 TaxID=2975749 RepID=UPI002E17B47A
MLPHHPAQALPADQVTWVGVTSPAPWATPQEVPPTVQSQSSDWTPAAKVAGAAVLVGAAGTWGVFWFHRRWRRNDQANKDVDKTIAVLDEVSVEAWRIKRLNGRAKDDDLGKLADLIPGIEHSTTQHQDTLHEHLTHVNNLMTALVSNPVELDTVESVLIASAALADVPEPMRLAHLAERIGLQIQTVDQLITAVTNATTGAKRLRK